MGMFFWVEAQKSIVPTIRVKDSIEKYFNHIGIDWDIETALTTYNRMKKEYLKNG